MSNSLKWLHEITKLLILRQNTVASGRILPHVVLYSGVVKKVVQDARNTQAIDHEVAIAA